MCVFVCVGCVLVVGRRGGGWSYNTAAVLLLTITLVLPYNLKGQSINVNGDPTTNIPNT